MNQWVKEVLTALGQMKHVEGQPGQMRVQLPVEVRRDLLARGWDFLIHDVSFKRRTPGECPHFWGDWVGYEPMMVEDGTTNGFSYYRECQNMGCYAKQKTERLIPIGKFEEVP